MAGPGCGIKDRGSWSWNDCCLSDIRLLTKVKSIDRWVCVDYSGGQACWRKGPFGKLMKEYQILGQAY